MLEISSESSSSHSSQELEDMNVNQRNCSKESFERTRMDRSKDNHTIQMSGISPRLPPGPSCLDEDPDELNEKPHLVEKEEIEL